MFSLFFYVLIIFIVNLGFSYIPMIETPIGMLSPMAVVVGLVFIMRDYAQRAVGHFVIFGMVAGAILSYAMADPYVAVASVLAFSSSEIADYVIYTITKKPFHQRILISSIISVPIDTTVFLMMISQLSVGTFLLMVVSKLVAALAIWAIYREQDRLAKPA